MSPGEVMNTLEWVRRRLEDDYRVVLSNEATLCVRARCAAEDLERAKAAVKDVERKIAEIDSALQALKVMP